MTTQCNKCHTENPDDSKFCRECATPLPQTQDAKVYTKTIETPREELTTGSNFAGRYQIIEELGRGGMGKVYKAVDTRIQEKIALKLIRPEISSDKQTIERFGNELKYARKISHRNVCRMYDLGEDQGSHYITMEYVPGEDLKSMLRMMGRMSPTQTVSIGRQICEGLEEAHRLGIVHRDLKPNNIMIDREGNARIMDFGIARSKKAKDITGTGIMIGTPAYMSPEQAEAKDIDRRSDLYSLGVILYEMVTGELPFQGDTPLAVAMKHKGESPRDPRELNSQIPDDLSDLILRCLAKKKEDRFQNTGELRTQLDNLEKNLPATSKVTPKSIPSTSKEITLSFQPKKLLVPAVVAVAAIILIFVLFQLIPKKGKVAAEKIENSIAVISFENLTGDKNYDYLRKAIPNLIITNLENMGGFYVATWERLQDLLKQIGKKEIDTIDKDLGFDLCRREGIEFIVLGTFTKAGNTFATDVKVLDVSTKDLLKSASSQGSGEDSILLTQIAELSREISNGVGISDDKIEAEKLQVVGVTTDSMEAYNYYLMGKEDYHKFYYPEALEYLQRALEIDPEFAMAHLYLGLVQSNLGNRTARDEAYKKAYQLSSHTTEKERLAIKSIYSNYIEQNWEDSKKALEELAEKYPKEKYVFYSLGVILNSRGYQEEAFLKYQKALELDPDYGIVHNSIAYIYADRGEFDIALKHFEKYASLNPNDANPVDSIAELYLRMGRLDDSLGKYKEVLEINVRFGGEWRIAYLYALKEDYASAFQWLELALERIPFPGIKAEICLWSGVLNFLLGRYREGFLNMEKAKEWAQQAENPFRLFTLYYTEGFMHLDRGDADSAMEYFKKTVETFGKVMQSNPAAEVLSHYLYGLVDLKNGQIESARQRLESLRDMLSGSLILPTRKAAATRWKNVLEAKTLQAEARWDEAIEYFAEMNSRDIPSMTANNLGPYIMPFARDGAAESFRKKGDLDRAIGEYERLMIIGPHTNNRRLINPIYHFRLAQIYEEKGWLGKAIEHYDKFLDLWKDADPGLPEKAEAQKHLSALR
ncbi:protein kinase [Acidobacteriota bacterium]